MSSIEKLAILGIRSYSPKGSEVIEFHTPLTVIVGPNGSGKTTIIECLRYATTGETPPGSRVGGGGGFVYDPKLGEENEVKGQVKLKFNNVNNKEMVVIRSLKAELKDNLSIKTTTIDSLIKVLDPITQEMTSLSKRCGDLDVEIPLNLGVSKPILDNVIFCHQEESNWPLSEPTPLKKKFDEIFSATKYAKALGNINELRKKKMLLLKEDKIMLDQCKKEKGRADNITIRLENDQLKEVNIKQKMETLDAQINTNSKDIDDLLETIRELDKINEEITVSKKEIEMLKSTRDELMNNMNELHESDEELQKIKEEYMKRLSSRQGDKQNLAAQKNQLESDYNKLRDLLNKTLEESGKLQSEKNINEKRIEELEVLVKETSRTHQFRLFVNALLDDVHIAKFKELLKTTIEEKERIFKTKRDQAQQKENELNARLNQLTSDFNFHNRTKQNARSIIDSKRKKKSKEMENLQDYQTSDFDIDILNDQLAKEESDLNTLKLNIENDNIHKTYFIKQNDLRNVENKINDIDSEISNITQDSSSRAKLDLQRTTRAEKSDQLQSLLTSHKDEFKEVLGKPVCIDTLEKDILKTLQKKEKELELTETEGEKLNRELSAIDGKLQVVQSESKRKNKEYQEYGQKLNAVCGDRDLPSIIKKVEEELTELRDLLSSFTNYSDLYRQFYNTSQKKQNCPLCHRGFSNTEELNKLHQKLQEYLNDKMPDKRSGTEREIVNTETRLNDLRDLQPVRIAVEKLQSEMPDLERQIEQLQDKRTNTESSLEDIYVNIAAVKVEISQVNILRKDAEKITRLHKEIMEIDADINNLQQLLSISGSTKTLEECVTERDVFQAEAKRIRIEIENFNKLKDTRALERSKRQDKVHQLRFRLQEQKNSMEKFTRIQNDINELTEEIKSQESSIKNLDEQISKLTPTIREVDNELKEFRRQKIEKENSLMQDLNEIKKSYEQFLEIERTIEKYNSNFGDKKLAACIEKIENIKQQMTTKKTYIENLDKQLQNMEKEASEIRDTERNIADNLKYRQCQNRIREINSRINEYNQKIISLGSSSNYKERLDELQKMQSNVLSERARLDGELKQLEETIRRATQELNKEYKNAREKYKEKFIEVKTNEMGIKDLERYGKALDNAIVRYHKLKMSEINKIIAELWIKTYGGPDIDYIEIKSDTEGIRSNQSYNYKVVMVKNGIHMDMRGRCSAGQKNLASIIIRLALAETFCLNCGVFVLDEPTTNLDEKHIERLASSLRSILESRRRQQNFQLIVITHDESFSKLLGQTEFSDTYIRVHKDENGYSVATEYAWDS
ncbi:hypothetical protein Glove_485g11 [Diversispora epigaea]|uniref:DNA repair protein RAD50 n=1 Tax=Diversispora epigaea TaxID=1348612 RepID=A0A397GNF9_9GLOM|nr:hypothetical protein Glove_485g11 [Diversispora epigaea]